MSNLIFEISHSDETEFVQTIASLITEVYRLLIGLIDNPKNDGCVEFKLGKMHQKKHEHEKAIEFFLASYTKKYALAERTLKTYASQESYQHLISTEVQNALFPPLPSKPVDKPIKKLRSKPTPAPVPVPATVAEVIEKPQTTTPQPQKASVENSHAKEQLELAKREEHIKREWEEIEHRWNSKPKETTSKPKPKKAAKPPAPLQNTEPSAAVTKKSLPQKTKGNTLTRFPVMKLIGLLTRALLAKNARKANRRRWNAG